MDIFNKVRQSASTLCEAIVEALDGELKALVFPDGDTSKFGRAADWAALLKAIKQAMAGAANIPLVNLQAARIVNPDCRRHVTLSLPKQGQLTSASKIVARLIRETVEGWGHQLSEPG